MVSEVSKMQVGKTYLKDSTLRNGIQNYKTVGGLASFQILIQSPHNNLILTTPFPSDLLEGGSQ